MDQGYFAFPKSYYKVCAANSQEKKAAWFCNKPLDPVLPENGVAEAASKSGKNAKRFPIVKLDRLISTEGESAVLKDHRVAEAASKSGKDAKRFPIVKLDRLICTEGESAVLKDHGVAEAASKSDKDAKRFLIVKLDRLIFTEEDSAILKDHNEMEKISDNNKPLETFYPSASVKKSTHSKRTTPNDELYDQVIELTPLYSLQKSVVSEELITENEISNNNLTRNSLSPRKTVANNEKEVNLLEEHYLPCDLDYETSFDSVEDPEFFPSDDESEISLSSPLICCTPPESSPSINSSPRRPVISKDESFNESELNMGFLEADGTIVPDNRSNHEDSLPLHSKIIMEKVVVSPPNAVDLEPKKIKAKFKKVFCYYCVTEVQNFPRHLIRNHKSELDVQKMLSLPAASKNRKELLFSLRKQGNYIKSNCNINKPVRKGNDNTNYLPCIHCLGFYSAKNLWRHRKTCAANPNKGQSSKQSKAEAQNFLVRDFKVDCQLREMVFPRMLADRISLVAKKDALICAFGARYFKSRREPQFVGVTSRKMRELARMLIEVQKIKPFITSLSDALRPGNYDTLVAATNAASKYDEKNKMYHAPTFAMNMGTSLKQCCDIALLHALKESNEFSVVSADREAEIRSLLQLISGNWKFDVSSQAAKDLSVQKWNKVTIVPLANDLRLLKDFLISKAQNGIAALQTNPTDQTAYVTLMETIYCRIILLNRRRPGELQRLSLSAYKSVILNDNPQTYAEFEEVISDVERALMQSFKRIVIRGKRGNPVPILISKDVQEHLDILNKHRDNILKKHNIYLFAQPNSAEPIVGYKVLRKYATLCGAKNPDALTCTRLRKHLATLCQLFNMSENDMEQLASFMGHTLGIHRKSYRLPDDIYQTSRISKLLILMEKGKAGDFKGKSLDEIDLNLDENLLTAPKDNEIPIQAELDKAELFDIIQKSPQPSASAVADECMNSKPTKRTLVPWTEEQKKIVCTYFKNHIKQNRPPKKAECDDLVSKNKQVLHNKNWLKIKVFVQNQYAKKK